ncbi:MBL fold metallo-hydrolase [Streptomyces sp. NBC_00893]|uniref:MBL fold metallo-hydrolase n=1 Tax=Streptomyces sp. NBC_00893 TaxID=2975862 RepID=UPI0022528D8B|nr:MBL fold metallo-hydrolase [Streptomyces sp. NBC_00893]MCX4852185.1 MBL fold metallo-hydrolase [Streptomyces sp. NBC_00893]
MRAPATSTPAATWTVGDITVQRVDEIALPPQTGPWLLPEATPEVVSRLPWLKPSFADGANVLRLASHSFALTIDGTRVLIDTGIGNAKPRANPAWDNLDTDYLARLDAIGFTPESVDLVVLTHLHTDHVGWNTRLSGNSWVPTFPNARYLTTRTEWDFWSNTELDEPRTQMFRDSIHPIRDAGLLDVVDLPAAGAAAVAPGLTLIPTPGHTPGQAAVRLDSQGARGLITGDCIHHPVQLADAGLGSCVDIDPEQAATTRRALLTDLADTDTLVLGSHFPAPTAGHVVTQGDAYRFVPSGS